VAFLLSKGGSMITEALTPHLRLRQDLKELEYYEYKLKKKGKLDLMKKIQRKKDFLKSYIETQFNYEKVAS
tara:strand:+ start:1999 stop:2211 length:213 start_codon:yes stop_codon:yes gene_type:complete